jgi:hypothetical protein
MQVVTMHVTVNKKNGNFSVVQSWTSNAAILMSTTHRALAEHSNALSLWGRGIDECRKHPFDEVDLPVTSVYILAVQIREPPCTCDALPRGSVVRPVECAVVLHCVQITSKRGWDWACFLDGTGISWLRGPKHSQPHVVFSVRSIAYVQSNI